MILADPNSLTSSSGDCSTDSLQDGIRNEVQPLLDSFGDGGLHRAFFLFI